MGTPVAFTPSAAGVFLLEDQVISSSGESAPFPLGNLAGKPVTLTLGILEALEQQSIEVQVFSSEDGENWPTDPAAEFPQRFYSGSTAIMLDLSSQPAQTLLKVKWTVNRWGRGEPTPRFRVFLFASA